MPIVYHDRGWERGEPRTRPKHHPPRRPNTRPAVVSRLDLLGADAKGKGDLLLSDEPLVVLLHCVRAYMRVFGRQWARQLKDKEAIRLRRGASSSAAQHHHSRGGSEVSWTRALRAR